MRIIHVVYSLIPGEFRGGVPKAAFELSTAQQQLGHDVTVLTTNLNSGIRTAYRSGDVITTKEGVEIHYYDALNKKTLRSPDLLGALARKALDADIIHGHSTYQAPNRYVDRVSQQLRTPAFYHPHGALDPLVVGRGAMKPLVKRIYISAYEVPLLNRAAGVFALTDAERRQLQGWGVQVPIHIVPNGVSVPDLRGDRVALRAHLGIPTTAFVILFLGRIVPKKGLHILVDAVRQMGESNVHLIIAGNPSQEPAYTTQIRSNAEVGKIDDRLHWIGFVPETGKGDVMAAADVFSHVSESEGMALSILEAMAYGLPTLVSKECYMDAAVQAGAVLEVDYDVAALAALLDQLASTNSALYDYGQPARRYVTEAHDWHTIAAGIVDHYAEAEPALA